MRGLVAFAVALIVALSFASPVAADRDCGDFATQGDAQRYFEDNGGSAGYNYDRLDADGDGFVCESLPSGGSTGSSRSSRSDYDYVDTEASYRADREMSDAYSDRYDGYGEGGGGPSSPFIGGALLELLFSPVGLGILAVLGVFGLLSGGRSES